MHFQRLFVIIFPIFLLFAQKRRKSEKIEMPKRKKSNLSPMLRVLKILFIALPAIALIHIIIAMTNPKVNKWKELNQRSLPVWYDRAKIGVFIHWGVYSVPAYKSEWFWWYLRSGDKDVENFMKKKYPPGFTYKDFAPLFTAENFDPVAWAELFKKSGIKYVVLTSKHHDGYDLFASKQCKGWNSVHVGPHRDLVGDLRNAIIGEGLEFGIYHSVSEWFNLDYAADVLNNFETRNYRDEKLLPDLYQLVNDYKPSILWSDGDWMITGDYLDPYEFLRWLYRDSLVRNRIVVNNRWVKEFKSDFYSVEQGYEDDSHKGHKKWEYAIKLDQRSWGYREDMSDEDVLSTELLVQKVVDAVSSGGNVLINIGPAKDGTIPLIFQERLLALGEWLEINGEAIYGTSPWLYQRDPENANTWYTCKNLDYNAASPSETPSRRDAFAAIYAIFLEWPEDDLLVLGAIDYDIHYKLELLDKGKNHEVDWSVANGAREILLPLYDSVSSGYGWVLRFTPDTSVVSL